MESLESLWMCGLYLFPRHQAQALSKASRLRRCAASFMLFMTVLVLVIWGLTMCYVKFVPASGVLRFLGAHLAVTVLGCHLFMKRNQIHELLIQIDSAAARCHIDRSALLKLCHWFIYTAYTMALAYVALHEYDYWRNLDGWGKRMEQMVSFGLLDIESQPITVRVYSSLFVALNYWTLAGPALAISAMISAVCSAIACFIEQLNQDLKGVAYHLEDSAEQLCQLKESYESLVDCVALAESCFSFTCLILFSSLGFITCHDAVWICLNDPHTLPALDLLSIFSHSIALWIPCLAVYWTTSSLHHQSSETYKVIKKLFRRQTLVAQETFGSLEAFQPMALSLGGFLDMHRNFILCFLSAVVTFSVMILQMISDKG